MNWNNEEEWNELPYPENSGMLTAHQETSQDVVDAKERKN